MKLQMLYPASRTPDSESWHQTPRHRGWRYHKLSGICSRRSPAPSSCIPGSQHSPSISKKYWCFHRFQIQIWSPAILACSMWPCGCLHISTVFGGEGSIHNNFVHCWGCIHAQSKQLARPQKVIYHTIVNPSFPKGGCTTPLTVLALVLKIAQPRGKIAPGTFKFILSLHFSFSKKIPNLPPTPGVG